MSTKITNVGASYSSVKVELETKNGKKFYLRISEQGLAFHSDQNSAGALTDNPIVKTPDDIFDWISREGKGKNFEDRKAFEERPSPRERLNISHYKTKTKTNEKKA